MGAISGYCEKHTALPYVQWAYSNASANAERPLNSLDTLFGKG